MIILTKFSEQIYSKRYSQLKTEQAVQGLQAFVFSVVNVNSTDVFKHFEDLKDLIILNILKEKLLCLASWVLFILKLCKAFQTLLSK